MTIPRLDPIHDCFAREPIARLGMGCWAIGGPFHAGGTPLGYGEVDDAESVRAVHAALDHGIRYFDTAAAYGAGHGERVLGRALAGRTEAFVSTKVGLAIDEAGREVLGEDTAPESVTAAVDAALSRLGRERIDLLFLHLNALPLERAAPVFDAIERAVDAGKVGAFGWSTDFPDRVEAMAAREGFAAVQHALNVLFSAPALMPVIERHRLLSIARSPLAMGVLTGKFDADSVLPENDVRANDLEWMAYFAGRRVRPEVLARLEAIGECLRVDGRSLTEGALGWIWARSHATVPIAGCRDAAQARLNARALEKGPLPEATMREIETLIDRTDEREVRER